MTNSLPSGERDGAPTGCSFTISGVSPSIGEQRPSLEIVTFFAWKWFGRFKYLALADGKRNLWKGLSAERPVRESTHWRMTA